MNLGIMVEGKIEMDPNDGRLALRVKRDDGSEVLLDLRAELLNYYGQEVRFIVTPMAAIAELARMVESGEVKV